MSSIWSHMSDEDKEKYQELKEELLHARTKNEVKYYAEQIHLLLDQVEIIVHKNRAEEAENL
ncbi:hypothetical protein ACFVAD_20300 [Sutcliffiella sp. NPDC057660]|uniref:hypothetical protein n=1 Tax=Sutcliffiella sp. NPDC057660 TaxID=3346199 RepID=UPI00368BFD31